MNERRSRMAALALASCGWFLSGGLLLRCLALAGRGTPIAVSRFPANCDEVLAGASAYQLGFPIAGWGLVYFALVALMIATDGRWPLRAALFVTAVGCGGSALLAATLISGNSASCFPCLAVHAINVALLVSLWILVSPGSEHSLHSWRLNKGVTVRLAPVLCAALLGGSVQAALFREDPEFRHALAELDRAPRQVMRANERDAMLGPDTAPVRLVVFSSFQCPACQSFDLYLRDIRRAYGDRVAIVFKHFPLGSACNPAVKVDLQPRACAAAYAADAARRQNAFWRYEQLLFASSLAASDEILVSAARGAGIDLQKWESDRRSPETLTSVLADAIEGNSLALDGTPTVFVNGKKAPHINRRVIGLMISRELSARR
jgi:protein-disulfide isomerase/uncharacterized membrane protein